MRCLYFNQKLHYILNIHDVLVKREHENKVL